MKREAAKALELSRAQQDLLLAEKASNKLQAERDDLGKKVSQPPAWCDLGVRGARACICVFVCLCTCVGSVNRP